MSAFVTTPAEMTVEEYFAAELLSDRKHDYLGGAVFVRAEASETHNRIAANLYGVLHQRLRGKPCESFGSDMKVRLFPVDSAYFYYPDAMVACDPTDVGHGWRERPTALFEIISEDTRRVDEREKRALYRQISSLKHYVRIEQGRAEVVIESLGPEGWVTEQVRGLQGVVRLSGLGLELPLAELYTRVAFPA